MTLAINLDKSVLKVRRLSENAKLPERGSELAAGYDLFRYYSTF